MLKMLSAIIRYGLLLLLGTALAGAAFKSREIFAGFTLTHGDAYLTWGLGFSTAYCFFLRRFSGFWGTLSHEMTHAVLCVLSFGKVSNLKATQGAGGEMGCSRVNFLILLGPYSVPLMTVMLMLFAPLVADHMWKAYSIALLLSYLAFLFTLFNQFGFHQTDLQRVGLHDRGFRNILRSYEDNYGTGKRASLLFSSVFIIEANLLFLLIFVVFLEGEMFRISYPLQFWWEGLVS